MKIKQQRTNIKSFISLIIWITLLICSTETNGDGELKLDVPQHVHPICLEIRSNSTLKCDFTIESTASVMLATSVCTFNESVPTSMFVVIPVTCTPFKWKIMQKLDNRRMRKRNSNGPATPVDSRSNSLDHQTKSWS